MIKMSLTDSASGRDLWSSCRMPKTLKCRALQAKRSSRSFSIASWNLAHPASSTIIVQVLFRSGQKSKGCFRPRQRYMRNKGVCVIFVSLGPRPARTAR